MHNLGRLDCARRPPYDPQAARMTRDAPLNDRRPQSTTKDPIDNILREPHMPWTSNSIFEARRNFVTLALTPNSNIRGLCRRFNISANTGYQTLERYRAEGEKGLQDRSHAPHRTPLRCSKATELAVLSVRADHPTWGGRRIASYLQLLGAAAVPAASTITAILIRNGRLKTFPKQSARTWLLVM